MTEEIKHTVLTNWTVLVPWMKTWGHPYVHADFQKALVLYPGILEDVVVAYGLGRYTTDEIDQKMEAAQQFYYDYYGMDVNADE